MLLAWCGTARAQNVTLSPMSEIVVGPSPQGFMETTRPQPPPPALDPASAASLQQARSLSRQGAYDAARALLEELLRKSPHHPSLVSELVQLGYADHDWPRLERLCRAERMALRDSLFLSRPLLQALTYQGRYRDAAQVAVEAVVAAPRAAPWVTVELRNLAIADPTGVKMTRDALRVAWTRNPQRDDLLLLLAELEWTDGRTEHALTLLETPAKLRGGSTTLLWQFAQQRMIAGTWADSLGAARAFLAVARHTGTPEGRRLAAARQAHAIVADHPEAGDVALEITRALRDVPPPRWGVPLGVGLARSLREGGHPMESRALLERLTADGAHAPPGLLIERALGDLRDGPPEAAMPLLGTLAQSPETAYEARFYLGEALFFSGRADSASAVYDSLARQAPGAAHTDAALDRLYLIEDARPPAALKPFARASYERWRGNPRAAASIVDSLFRVLPRGTLWARCGIMLSEVNEELGLYREALAPLVVVADSLPADRLAPLARKRIGDLYRTPLKDPTRALRAYEECLARYPRSWLSPEVRRIVEEMRRSRTM